MQLFHDLLNGKKRLCGVAEHKFMTPPSKGSYLLCTYLRDDTRTIFLFLEFSSTITGLLLPLII